MAPGIRKFATGVAAFALMASQTGCGSDNSYSETYSDDMATADSMAEDEMYVDDAMVGMEPDVEVDADTETMADASTDYDYSDYDAYSENGSNGSYQEPSQSYNGSGSNGSSSRNGGPSAGEVVVGGLILAGLACLIFCGGGSKSSKSDRYTDNSYEPDFGNSNRSDTYYDDYRPSSSQSSDYSSEQPAQRSYGLHGDCPQSGAGYGC